FGLLPLVVLCDLAEGITLGCSVCCCLVAKILISAVVCTLAIGSSSYMGMISTSSACASLPNLLLVSYSFSAVPLLSVSTKLASNALLESTLSSIVCIYLSFTQLTGRLLGAYDLRVATPRALVHAGDKTSKDARGGRRVREPRRRNVEPTSEPEGQRNDQGVEVNEGVDRVPDFSTNIAQQLQNLLPTILVQVGNQGSNQGDNRNQSDIAVNDNIQGDVRNVIVKNGKRGCTYKEFLACNPKEYDGKGGVIVYTH
ncbi:hypothetical protein Tco_1088711, partial [Tanacetum coccineum]